MKQETAIRQGLEPIYPAAHPLGERIYWDKKEGKYYDASTDLFLENFDPHNP